MQSDQLARRHDRVLVAAILLQCGCKDCAVPVRLQCPGVARQRRQKAVWQNTCKTRSSTVRLSHFTELCSQLAKLSARMGHGRV